MADLRTSSDRLAAGKVIDRHQLTTFLVRLWSMKDDELRVASVARAVKSYPGVNPNWLAEYIRREQRQRGFNPVEWEPVEWAPPKRAERRAPDLPPPMEDRGFATYWGPDMEPCPHDIKWPKNCVPCATAMQRAASPIPVGRRAEVFKDIKRGPRW